MLEAARVKTNSHHRQKRKLHKFGWYFITKWPLPIQYTFDTNLGKLIAVLMSSPQTVT